MPITKWGLLSPNTSPPFSGMLVVASTMINGVPNTPNRKQLDYVREMKRKLDEQAQLERRVDEALSRANKKRSLSPKEKLWTGLLVANLGFLILVALSQFNVI